MNHCAISQLFFSETYMVPAEQTRNASSGGCRTATATPIE